MDDDGMTLGELLDVLDALRSTGCRVWVEGGWGVDALVGRQTRPHRDLDLAFDAVQEAMLLGTLDGLGYAPEGDWRPVRMELRAPGRGIVDIHPLVFDAVGNGIQARWDGASYVYPRDGFTAGSLGGQLVPCLSIEQQIAFHAGYAPRDLDRHDLAVLAELAAQPRPGDRIDRPVGGAQMDDKVNLAEKLATFTEHWKPKIVGYFNGNKVYVIKNQGEFVWHTHDDTDDLFLVLRGTLTMRLRDREVAIGPGELFVVPRGVEHCPYAAEETHMLVIEAVTAVNTGDAGGPLTAQPEEI